ncbi:MAG: hypothetical protein JNN08_26580 [Bryobacterales bacterium]|nr:hypothetical protein [Bryobacterales bacterium]
MGKLTDAAGTMYASNLKIGQDLNKLFTMIWDYRETIHKFLAGNGPEPKLSTATGITNFEKEIYSRIEKFEGEIKTTASILEKYEVKGKKTKEEKKKLAEKLLSDARVQLAELKHIKSVNEYLS